MFRSATLKLTAWYVGILMTISILFSIAIYQISLSEVNARLAHYGTAVQFQTSVDATGRFRTAENRQAANTFSVQLTYINVVILIVGSGISYVLARRTLRPVQEAHEAQARFVSDASHELRTPLAVMKSELEVTIRDANLSKEELRHILRSNLEEVDSLSRMSEMLLAMSRMDHKKLHKQALDLNVVATEAVNRFKQPHKRLALSGRTIKVLANETSLIELMTVLIDNALKYSPEDTTVVVQVGSTKNNQAFFSVSNEGCGIEAEALNHIFDRFYRSDSSRTSGEHKGFGLGLSIAKQIAELHNGEITATSAPNEVTEFRYLQQKII